MTNTEKNDFFLKISVALIVITAIAIRVIAFISNHYDISIDECHSIIWCRDNLKDTLTNFVQGANFLQGYKLLLKCIYSVFKFNYTAFKFPSLIAGILAIFAFKSLSFKIFKNKYLAVLSLLLFTFNFTVIYYSNVIKPYEFDILFSLFIINLFITVDETGINEFLKRKTKYLYGISSLIILLCSIPSVVIFCLCSLILFVKQLMLKDKQSLIKLTKIYPCFLILLLIEYFTYINKMIGDSGLKDMWLSNNFFFMPNSLDAVNALINFSFIKFTWWDYNVEFYFNNIIIISLLILFFIGTYNFLKKDNLKNGIYICSPVFFFILLSFLKIYPFTNRCITFLIPIFILILLKAFDINVNKPIKVICIVIALYICGFYLHFITVDYPFLPTYLKKNNQRITMIKNHLLSFENLKDNEILFSTGTPCYMCFNNQNLIMLMPKENYIKDGKITPEFDKKIEFKNKIYLNYTLIDDDIEDINTYKEHIENKGYKLINNFDNISGFSYLEFEKYPK